MARRHLLRSIVMQTLFEWDLSSYAKEQNISELLERNMKEFAPGETDTTFVEKLLSGVLKKQEILDDIITKAAPDWPLEKIANVDRNVLRIGLYELLFADRDHVPPKVAINEAIELAKSFGGESSGKFINGVLGAVYREMGEPGKDHESSNIKDIPYEQMPIEQLAGAIVYAEHEDDFYLALVHDVFGHWTLSKGGVEEGESTQDCAIRELKEETGLDIEIIEEVDKNEYIAADPEKGKIRKQVTYYLAKADYQELKLPDDKGGLDDAKWFILEEIPSLNFYDDVLPIVTKAIKMIPELKSNQTSDE